MRHNLPIVNPGHPLNQGLISWWLVPSIPTMGRFQWRDLCGINPMTMSGGATSLFEWGSPIGRPGGHGAFKQDATGDAQMAKTSARRTVDVTAAQSEAAWIYTTTTGSTKSILSIDAGGFSQAVQLELRSTTLRASFPGGSAYVDSAVTPDLSTWYHVLYTWDGTTNRIYINGVEKANSVTAHSAGLPDRIKIADTGFNEQWEGRLDDLRYWGRCLTPADARQVYDNSRTGYVGVLIRPRQSRLHKTTVAATTSHFLTLLGVGA